GHDLAGAEHRTNAGERRNDALRHATAYTIKVLIRLTPAVFNGAGLLARDVIGATQLILEPLNVGGERDYEGFNVASHYAASRVMRCHRTRSFRASRSSPVCAEAIANALVTSASATESGSMPAASNSLVCSP